MRRLRGKSLRAWRRGASHVSGRKQWSGFAGRSQIVSSAGREGKSGRRTLTDSCSSTCLVLPYHACTCAPGQSDRVLWAGRAGEREKREGSAGVGEGRSDSINQPKPSPRERRPNRDTQHTHHHTPHNQPKPIDEDPPLPQTATYLLSKHSLLTIAQTRCVISQPAPLPRRRKSPFPLSSLLLEQSWAGSSHSLPQNTMQPLEHRLLSTVRRI